MATHVNIAAEAQGRTADRKNLCGSGRSPPEMETDLLRYRRTNVMVDTSLWSVGAHALGPSGASFHVWAPLRKRVEVVLESGPGAPAEVDLEPEDGYFSGILSEAGAGTCYRYRLDGDSKLLPDPASRFQPDGPHGSSEIIDPSGFAWTDFAWPGVELQGQVIYELHIGTFTADGTWDAARRQLPELADARNLSGGSHAGRGLPRPLRLGLRRRESICARPGSTGGPTAFRRFVDEAHANGIGVILDVVYNHFGPDGNYVGEFSPFYFTESVRERMGSGDQLRRRKLRPGARVLRFQRRLLDSRFSSRRPPAGRNPADFR